MDLFKTMTSGSVSPRSSVPGSSPPSSSFSGDRDERRHPRSPVLITPTPKRTTWATGCDEAGPATLAAQGRTRVLRLAGATPRSWS